MFSLALVFERRGSAAAAAAGASGASGGVATADDDCCSPSRSFSSQLWLRFIGLFACLSFYKERERETVQK